MKLMIQTVVSMPFAENTYIAWREGQTEAIVIDPGLEPEAIQDMLQEHGLSVVSILNTHGHSDHIAGNGFMKRNYPDAPLIIGVKDAPMLLDADLNLSAGYGFEIISPPADRTVVQGETLELAGLKMQVYDVPGHSPGHVVFHLEEQKIIFGGDVLFRGGIGRTDFPGGSFEVLALGIREKLFPLDPETVVYSGHGPVTKIGYEKRTNPFVGDGASKTW
jgi:hydroxyacylglutathione hydrolase